MSPLTLPPASSVCAFHYYSDFVGTLNISSLFSDDSAGSLTESPQHSCPCSGPASLTLTLCGSCPLNGERKMLLANQERPPHGISSDKAQFSSLVHLLLRRMSSVLGATVRAAPTRKGSSSELVFPFCLAALLLLADAPGCGEVAGTRAGAEKGGACTQSPFHPQQ